MPQIIVRNIDNSLKERLRRRARRHGISMEQEVRNILREALRTETPGSRGLGSEIAAIFKDIGLREGEEIPELRGWELQVPDFRE